MRESLLISFALLLFTGCTVDADGDGYVSAETDGPDCDDSDASVNPLAEEIAYDGIDQDCSGSDLTDVDGDGHDDVSVGGDDCDDENDGINPSITDIVGDGVDQDCSGADATLDDLGPPPALPAQLPLADCDGYTDPNTGAFTPVAAATVYYVAEFNSNATTLSGEEAMHIVPNARWQAVAPNDAFECDVFFDWAGDVQATSWPTEQFAASIHIAVNRAKSTCTSAVVDGFSGSSSEFTFDVALECIGVDQWCAATLTSSNGGYQSSGWNAAGDFVLQSEGKCQFF